MCSRSLDAWCEAHCPKRDSTLVAAKVMNGRMHCYPSAMLHAFSWSLEKGLRVFTQEVQDSHQRHCGPRSKLNRYGGMQIFRR